MAGREHEPVARDHAEHREQRRAAARRPRRAPARARAARPPPAARARSAPTPARCRRRRRRSTLANSPGALTVGSQTIRAPWRAATSTAVAFRPPTAWLSTIDADRERRAHGGVDHRGALGRRRVVRRQRRTRPARARRQRRASSRSVIRRGAKSGAACTYGSKPPRTSSRARSVGTGWSVMEIVKEPGARGRASRAPRGGCSRAAWRPRPGGPTARGRSPPRRPRGRSRSDGRRRCGRTSPRARRRPR